MNHSDKFSDTAIVYIGIGSNIGDRAAYINKALAILEATPGIILLKMSELFETIPVGGPENQSNFLNGAVMIKCQLPPTTLLELLLNIENKLGRKRQDHWGSRTIDLDILLFNDHIIDLPNLKVPHPLMNQRLFVIEPLAQIAPDAIHPESNKTISQILQDLR
ncbi:MAG: 2-amino-4-hydroxy-6-hydroxymethyldihydropteridine diphosphokinase [Phycisphaerae bacterium]|nr:2-amino-4-hydroxy-6-hydroxymethyldihydropteridine diphosphokinase [Phycisphaerae bacterium]